MSLSQRAACRRVQTPCPNHRAKAGDQIGLVFVCCVFLGNALRPQPDAPHYDSVSDWTRVVDADQMNDQWCVDSSVPPKMNSDLCACHWHCQIERWCACPPCLPNRKCSALRRVAPGFRPCECDTHVCPRCVPLPVPRGTVRVELC